MDAVYGHPYLAGPAAITHVRPDPSPADAQVPRQGRLVLEFAGVE